MAHDIIQPEGWVRPKGYSNGILAQPGRHLYVAGMIGWDGNEVMETGGFLPQFRRALANVVAVVEAAGGKPEHITRLRIFVTNKADYLGNISDVGATYYGIMGANFPAMALVEVSALLEDEARVEIEADAVIPV